MNFGPDLFRGEPLEEVFVQLAGSNVRRLSIQAGPVALPFSHLAFESISNRLAVSF
jgi:hypothetical protein